MNWLLSLFAIILVLSIGFEILGDVLDFIAKVIGGLRGPREWWKGTLARGSFRPGAWTVLGQLFVILTFLGLLAFAFVATIGSNANWPGWLIVLGLVFLPVAIKKTWSWFRKKEQASVQRRRDRAAMELTKASFSEGAVTQAYCLYLRPFLSTGQLPICIVASKMYIKYPAVVGRTRVEEHHEFADLETLLAMAVESNAPLVALGRPGEQVGAGRILTTEESWNGEFARLSAGAAVLFLLPSPTSGTRWELRRVLEDDGLISKTVFLIPPAVGASDVHHAALRTFESEGGPRRFRLIGDHFKDESIGEAGALFRFAPGGTAIVFSAPLVTYARPSLLTFLMDLWLSRETKVFSGSRFRQRILAAIDATKARNSRPSGGSGRTSPYSTKV